MSEAAQPITAQYAREIAEHRQKRDAATLGADGWVSVVGLHWLDEGETTFGSGADAGYSVPHPQLQEICGSFIRRGSKVSFRARPGANVRSAGFPVDVIEMIADSSAHLTVLDIGALRVYVIDRDDQIGIRVKDLDHSSTLRLPKLEYYPIAPAGLIRCEAVRRSASYEVPDVLGYQRTYASSVEFHFVLGGQDCRLAAFDPPVYARYQAGLSDDEVSVLFSDLSCAPKYRVVTVRLPSEGAATIDFNRAENPPCSFSVHLPCPLPPASNRLQVAIEAGEKIYDLGG